MLDKEIKNQLIEIFSPLNANYTLVAKVSPAHPSRSEFVELLEDVASTSPKIDFLEEYGEQLSLDILKEGVLQNFRFRAVPNGHEFTSLLLAILNLDGKGKNIPDANTIERIKNLKGPIKLTTYISLSCTNCPDIVQSLNIISMFNPNIYHETVDGAIHQEEVESLAIQAVPAVFADDQLFHAGRGELGELLSKLEEKYGVETTTNLKKELDFDVVVVGGGPAGASAAIYSARKGLRVAMVADTVGGQVKETVGIENLITFAYTTGKQLAGDLKTNILNNGIELFEHRRIQNVVVEGRKKYLSATSGETFIAPVVIVTTGASWRKLNIPGESEYIGKGVAFCPHCDGPFYKSKEVAVVGGGNSGIEAAIDLAGICSKVTVIEYLDSLKADKVLQDKLATLPNVEVFCNRQTTRVVGNGDKVTALKMKIRDSDEEITLPLDGIFVQIGLNANSGPFKDVVEVNKAGEIVVDLHGRTNIPGIYAAGDVTNIPFKQIIISMGEGAKASLSAFEDQMKGLF